MSELTIHPRLIQPEIKRRFAALLARHDLILSEQERQGVDTMIGLAQEVDCLRAKLDDLVVDNERLALAATDTVHGQTALRSALRAARDERDLRRLNEQELRQRLEIVARGDVLRLAKVLLEKLEDVRVHWRPTAEELRAAIESIESDTS
jgi:hypothetical protein